MFEQLNALSADPLLGLIQAFRDDPNPRKVDMGVGVYRDNTGHTPIMSSIQKAAQKHLDSEDSKSYISPLGVPGFVDGIKQMVLGNSGVLTHSRMAGMQTPGGCGALRIGSELLMRLKENLTIWVSDPTWGNHVPLISSTGLEIKTYPYLDTEANRVNFEAMDTQLSKLGKQDVVLLHGCCHNPTGADLSFEQWQQIADRASRQGFTTFVDIAYQGFGDGLIEDVKGVRYLSEKVEEMIIVTSCSKNFGLYRDRVGTLLVQTSDSNKAAAIQTQIQEIARSSYSMAPAYGGFLVDIILHDKALRKEWEDELNTMALRVKSLRNGLVEKIQLRNINKDFSFIKEQKGMFSYLGISFDQVRRLRKEFGIYLADTSRVNIAGLNDNCLDYVVDALEVVL